MVSGVALLIMAIAAGFAYGYALNSLVVPTSASETLSNLKDNMSLFGKSIFGWLIILITDLLVAFGLYKYFAGVDRKISLATGLVRGLYSVVLAVAIYQLVLVYQMLQTSQPDATAAMQLLDGFETYWSRGLILFGIHLVGLGYLALKSNDVPKWMGWLLYVAGFSYSAIHAAKALAPTAVEVIAKAEMVLAAPMAIAELGLAVWLIWKGGKVRLSEF